MTDMQGALGSDWTGGLNSVEAVRVQRDEVPEVRISPDFRLVAIRNHPTKWSPWSVSNGGYWADEHVADWLPMVLRDP